jgi:coenzyme F420-0:L-glutamate ligase/coenzyme F420-1:gamma-L-glutamate ligase
MEAFTVENVPLIKAGDDIASIICQNAEVMDNDIIIIASTIVSKSEGRMFRLEEIEASEEAARIAQEHQTDPRFVQAVLDRSRDILLESPIFLVETNNGHVCIKAGIDASNVDTGFLVDLPADPDVSAENIGKRIEDITGRKISVIITDTNGRAFKIGQTGVAVGLYRIHPIRDWKGEKDLFGNILQITEESVADEIAGTANLLMGEGGSGYPIVIIRGMELRSDDKASVKEMYRNSSQDIIRKGLCSLRHA